MSESKKQTQQILWSIDALAQKPNSQAQVAKTLHSLFKGTACSIAPVFVSRPAPSGIFLIEEPRLQKEIATQAEKNAKPLLKTLNLKDVSQLQIINANSPSINAMVKELLEYAEKRNFDLIAIGTHARKGIPRLFMGSFAERLILESKLPLLVINPLSKVKAAKKKKLLVPMDFTDASKNVLEKAIDLARERKMELELLHKEEFLYPELPYPFITAPAAKESLEKMREQWRETGKKWIDRAKSKDVKANFTLVSGVGSIADSIIKTAKRLSVSAIAMGSQSNAMQSALMGSVTRQVLRTAPCPVFVIHPEEKTKQTIRHYPKTAAEKMLLS